LKIDEDTMDNRIFIEDQLKAVSLKLTGVSQLLRFAYEMSRQEGTEGEHLVVMDDTICQCRQELIDLVEKL
jgi:hypothetical protein